VITEGISLHDKLQQAIQQTYDNSCLHTVVMLIW